MDSWRNIDIASDDAEINRIDQMQESLGDLPESIFQVRELITRFEVCHFKCQRHYYNILESIRSLNPVVDVEKIGLTHPRWDGESWRFDLTGRSKLGKIYVEALRLWVGDPVDTPNEALGQEIIELEKEIDAWLGEKNEIKEKLIRMLIARLLWKSVEPYRGGGELSEIEYQVEATDICNYAFPANLEKLIKAIGIMMPLKEFDGCGTFNTEIYQFFGVEFKKLCSWLDEDTACLDAFLGQKDRIKIWLVACLAKTIKTDFRFEDSIPII